MQLNAALTTRLNEESHGDLRVAWSLLKTAESRDPHHASSHTRKLWGAVQRLLERTLFGVAAREDLFYNGKKLVRTNKLVVNGTTVTNYRRYQILDESQGLYRITLVGGELAPLIKKAQSQGYHFLGARRNEKRTQAIFLKGDSFEQAMLDVFGDIGARVVKSDKMADLQSLVVLCAREGMKPLNKTRIAVSQNIDNNPAFDGLCIRLSDASWQELVREYHLPRDSRWAQVTYLDPKQGVGFKGAVMCCEEGEHPCVFSESIKFGIPSWLDTEYLTVMTTDSLYRAQPTMNLQMLAYNYSRYEQQVILNNLFLPRLMDQNDWSEFRGMRSSHKLAAMGIFTNPEKIWRDRVSHLMRRTGKVSLTGIRVKAVPTSDIYSFAIKVPLNCGISHGQWVDVHRDPSLPIGTGTQRYKVIGYTEGNYCMLGSNPWTTIQGGDFDGDDVLVFTDLVDLLPNVKYNQTPMSTFINKKAKTRTGVNNLNARYEQAVKSIESKGSIGIFDVTARRMEERSILDEENRLWMSDCIQKAIDAAKKDVEIPEAPKMPEREVSGFLTTRKLYKEKVFDRSAFACLGETNPVYKSILTGFDRATSIPLPKSRSINMDAARGKLHVLCKSDGLLPGHVRALAKEYVAEYNGKIAAANAAREEGKDVNITNYTSQLVDKFVVLMESTNASWQTWCLALACMDALPLMCAAFSMDEIEEALSDVVR